MKILLTGAAGFLGSHISKKLIDNNHEVIGLDDLSTGSIKNIEQLINHAKYSFIEHDVRIPYQAKVDAILNFACPASPVNYQKDPVRTIETNFLGMINLLHLANETGARIIQASTSEIYGDPTQSPQKESYWGNVNPIGIRSCYDEGKRAAETLCFDYRRQHNLDTRVIRIFNTYGPSMAIGDGRNDIDMFRWAQNLGGHAFAMGQAPEEVKLAASAVTAAVTEDGVAQVLKSLEGLEFFQ